MKSESDNSAAFRKRCDEAGLLSKPPGVGNNDALYGLNDDATLQRFLRADKLDVDKAFARYQAACSTRNKLDLIKAYDAIDVPDFEKARILYPHWTGRRDKRGKPICFFDIARLDANVLNEYSAAKSSTTGASSAMIRSLAFHDCLTRFVLPLCSEASKSPEPVTSCLYLVDISSFGIKQAWNVRSYAADISKVLANDYPEMIDKVLVIGAPRLFGQIWKIVKGWIDPVTASKIEILEGHDVVEQLTTYIEQDHLPVQFGGKQKFSHGMLPDPDKQTKTLFGTLLAGSVQQLEGPFKWVHRDTEVMEVVPVGSVAGTPRSIAVSGR